MQIENNALEDSISDQRYVLSARVYNGIDTNNGFNSDINSTFDNSNGIGAHHTQPLERIFSASAYNGGGGNSELNSTLEDRHGIDKKHRESQENIELGYRVAAPRSFDDLGKEPSYNWQINTEIGKNIVPNESKPVQNKDEIVCNTTVETAAPVLDNDSSADTVPLYALPSSPASAASFVQELYTITPVDSVKEDRSKSKSHLVTKTETLLSDGTTKRSKLTRNASFDKIIKELESRSIEHQPITSLADYLNPEDENLPNKRSVATQAPPALTPLFGTNCEFNEQINTVINHSKQIYFESKVIPLKKKRPPPDLLLITEKEVSFNKYNETDQMGIDVLWNKVRRFFSNVLNSNSDSDRHGKSQKTCIKRRAYDLAGTEHQFKYRRVNNTFPRIAVPQMEAQDEDCCIVNGSTNFSPINEHCATNKDTSDARYNIPKHRRSLFDAPRITRKIIRNPNLIEIDLSDDDDDEENASTGNIAHAYDSLFGACKTNSTSNWQSRSQRQRAGEPPPLWDARTGGFATTSRPVPASPVLMPAVSYRRNALSYADAVRHGANNADSLASNGYAGSLLNEQTIVEYGRSSSLSSHDVSTSGSAHLNASSSIWNAVPTNNILNQANDNEEHAIYLRFLKEAIPKIYDVDIQPQQHQLNSNLSNLNQSKKPPQPLLSSTINLDDYDDESERDVELQERVDKLLYDDDDILLIDNVPENYQKQKQTHTRFDKVTEIPTIDLDEEKVLPAKKATEANDIEIVDDDDDIIEISDHQTVIGGRAGTTNVTNTNLSSGDMSTGYVSKFDKMKLAASNLHNKKPDVQPTNSLMVRYRHSDLLRADWELTFMERWKKARENRVYEKNLLEDELKRYTEGRWAVESEIRRRISDIQLLDKPLVVSVQESKVAKEDKDKLIPLTNQHRKRISEAIDKPPNHLHISKFSLNIRRSDLYTLTGSNWLNDEVINFYMNLLTERSEQRAGELPTVYAMSTFFVTRLLNAGYAGVKRWTRKVNLFSKDIIPVPVHVGGVHWCMAIIHLRDKTIKYYDSMGKPNPTVLKALEHYIQQESLDKRQQPLDTNEFKIESVSNVPQQTNGSDCGVFSCMFAEYITRDKPITFSQDNMEYFRQKMMLEILDGKLWN